MTEAVGKKHGRQFGEMYTAAKAANLVLRPGVVMFVQSLTFLLTPDSMGQGRLGISQEASRIRTR